MSNNNSNTEYFENSFSDVYPNPSAGEIKIDVSSDKEEDLVIEIFDITGNLIINQKQKIEIGAGILAANLENHQTGLYYIRLLDKDGSIVYRQTFVKK